MSSSYMVKFYDKLIVPKYMLNRTNSSSGTSCLRPTPFGLGVFLDYIDTSYYNALLRNDLKQIRNMGNGVKMRFAYITKEGDFVFRQIHGLKDQCRENTQYYDANDGLIVAFGDQDNKIRVLETIGYQFKPNEAYKLVKLMNNMFPNAQDWVILDINKTAAKIKDEVPLPPPKTYMKDIIDA